MAATLTLTSHGVLLVRVCLHFERWTHRTVAKKATRHCRRWGTKVTYRNLIHGRSYNGNKVVKMKW